MVLAFGLWDPDLNLGRIPGLTLPPFPTAPSSLSPPSLKPSFLLKQPLPHPAPAQGSTPSPPEAWPVLPAAQPFPGVSSENLGPRPRPTRDLGEHQAS